VTKVEGLYSYKAIAFIRTKSNPKIKNVKTKTYSKPPNSLNTSKIFSGHVFSIENPTENILTKN